VGYLDSSAIVIFFFFQAEDGIRDWSVTGVQTCALPICIAKVLQAAAILGLCPGIETLSRVAEVRDHRRFAEGRATCRGTAHPDQIGRASCRERVEGSGGGGALRNKGQERGGTETGRKAA